MEEIIEMPKNYLFQQRTLRFSTIFTRMTFAFGAFALILVLAVALSDMLFGFAYGLTAIIVVGISAIIIIATIGSIFLVENNIISRMWSFLGSFSEGGADKIQDLIFSILPICSAIALVLGILAMVFLVASKQFKNRILRVIWTVIWLAVAVFALIYGIVGGGA